MCHVTGHVNMSKGQTRCKQTSRPIIQDNAIEWKNMQIRSQNSHRKRMSAIASKEREMLTRKCNHKIQKFFGFKKK